MKNILKTILFGLLILTLGSCTKNDTDPKVMSNPFTLRAPDAVSPVVLTPLSTANTIATLNWDKSNNGVASVSTYVVEIADHAADPNFANPQFVNGGNDIQVTNDSRTYVLKAGEMNTLINQLPAAQCGVVIAIDIRVKSTLGSVVNNTFLQYSNVISILVTPYSTALPVITFAMTSQNPANTPKMAASSIFTTDYEGYMYLQSGSYLFYKPDSCNGFAAPTVYGDDGTFSNLIVNGDAYTITTAGVYRVSADTTTGLYSVTPISAWGIIGQAKLIGTGTSNPALTYDPVNNIYKSTAPTSLRGGKTFRFRANNSDVISLAKFDPTKTGANFGGPLMTYNGIEIPVPGIVTGVFDITLDLSSPRNYKYILVLHP